MRFRNIALAFLMLALAMPAFAQEQRASIEGVVKDATGAVMPGVTVEAKNEAIGVVVTAVTDANGVLPVPVARVRHWDVTATLAGFNTASTPDVPLTLGQIKKVDFTLAVAGVAESVQVTAESPLVDVRQSARSTSIRNEQIDLLPRGRDFSSARDAGAGRQQRVGKLGGLSIDGASAGENRFIVDGVETTNLQSGVQGKGVICRLRRRSPGEVVGLHRRVRRRDGRRHQRRHEERHRTTSAATRSVQLESDSSTASNRPIAPPRPGGQHKAQYQTYPEDTYNRFEPGVALGGPIVEGQDVVLRAYQPTMTTTTRWSHRPTSGNPNCATASDVGVRRTSTQYISANSTAQIGNNMRTRVVVQQQLEQAGRPASGADAARTAQPRCCPSTTRPNWSLFGQPDWVATPSWYHRRPRGLLQVGRLQRRRAGRSRATSSSSAISASVGTNGRPCRHRSSTRRTSRTSSRTPRRRATCRHAELPDGPDLLRDRGRSAHDQGRFPVRPRRQRRADGRTDEPGASAVGHRNSRGSARRLRLLPGAQQRPDPKLGIITEGNVHTQQHRAVHPGRVDGQQQADHQRRPPDRAGEGPDVRHRKA